jgi:Na+-driven multidrug efflux pump
MTPMPCGSLPLPLRTILVILVPILVIIAILAWLGVDGAGIAAVLSGLTLTVAELCQLISGGRRRQWPLSSRC